MKKYLILIVFLFIVGIYNVNALEIPVNSYVIGEYLFTRDGSDTYNGQLSTDYIMLASKSIGSKNLQDMTIYFKIADGQYINGATGVEIDDSFLEHDLSRKIKYYNMKKIPSVRIAYDAKFGTSMPVGSDGIPNWYSFDYNVYDKDEENNLEYGVDFYGSDSVDVNASVLSAVYYPDQEGFSSMNLTKMENNTGGLSGNVGTRFEFDSTHTKYTVFAYPYVNVVNRANETKKVYLNIESSNVISVRQDLNINRNFENGEVKINVTDSTGKKYKISSVLLYKTFEDVGNHNYFDIFDLMSLYKQHDSLKEMYDKNTYEALLQLQDQFNNKHLEIVDAYTATTNMQENMIDEVVMHDLGNSENTAGGIYGVYAQVIDDDDNVYSVAGAHVSWDQNIVLGQPTIDDAYMNSTDSSLDLLQTIVFLNTLLSLSE